MDKFYLQFNAVNFITVVLMAMVGFAVVNFLVSAMRGFPDGGDNA